MSTLATNPLLVVIGISVQAENEAEEACGEEKLTNGIPLHPPSPNMHHRRSLPNSSDEGGWIKGPYCSF